MRVENLKPGVNYVTNYRGVFVSVAKDCQPGKKRIALFNGNPFTIAAVILDTNMSLPSKTWKGKVIDSNSQSIEVLVLDDEGEIDLEITGVLKRESSGKADQQTTGRVNATVSTVSAANTKASPRESKPRATSQPEKKHESLKEENTRLRENISAVHKQNKSLLNHLQSQSKTLKALKDQVREMVDAKDNAHIDLGRRLEKLEAKWSKNEPGLTKNEVLELLTEESAKSLLEEKAKIQEEYQGLQQRVDPLENALNTLKRQVQDVVNSKDEKAIHEMRTRLESLEKDLNDVRKKSRSLAVIQDEMKKVEAQLNKTNTHARLNLDRLAGKHNTLTMWVKKYFNYFKKRVVDTDARVTKLEGNLTEREEFIVLRNRLQPLEDDLKELHQALDIRDPAFDSLLERVKALEGNKGAISTLSESLLQVEKQVAIVQLETQASLENIQETFEEHEAKLEEIGTQQDSLWKWQRQVDDLNDKLQASFKQIREWFSENGSRDQNLQDRITPLEQEVYGFRKVTESDIPRLQSTCELLKKELDDWSDGFLCEPSGEPDLIFTPTPAANEQAGHSEPSLMAFINKIEQELERISDQCKELTKEMRHLSSYQTAIEERLQGLETQKDNQNLSPQAQKEMETLRLAIETNKRRVNDTKNSLGEISIQFQEKLDILLGNGQTLETTSPTMQEQLFILHEAISDIGPQMETLIQTNNSFETRLSGFTNSLGSYLTRLEDLERNQPMTDSLNSLQGQFENLNSIVEKLNAEEWRELLQPITANFPELKRNIEKLQLDFGNLDQELGETKKMVLGHTQQIALANERLNAQEEMFHQWSKLHNTIGENKNMLEDLHRKYLEIAAETATQKNMPGREEWDQQKDRFKQELKHLETKISTRLLQDDSILDISKKIDDVDQNIDKTTQKLQELDNFRMEFTNALDNGEFKNISSFFDTVSRTRIQLEGLESDALENLKHTRQDLQETHRRIQAEIHKARPREDLQPLIWEEGLSKVNARVAALETMLKEITPDEEHRTEMETLQTQLAEMRGQLAKIRETGSEAQTLQENKLAEIKVTNQEMVDALAKLQKSSQQTTFKMGDQEDEESDFNPNETIEDCFLDENSIDSGLKRLQEIYQGAAVILSRNQAQENILGAGGYEASYKEENLKMLASLFRSFHEKYPQALAIPGLESIGQRLDRALARLTNANPFELPAIPKLSEIKRRQMETLATLATRENPPSTVKPFLAKVQEAYWRALKSYKNSVTGPIDEAQALEARGIVEDTVRDVVDLLIATFDKNRVKPVWAKLADIFNRDFLPEILKQVDYELMVVVPGQTIADARLHDIQGTSRGYEEGVVVEVIQPGLRRLSDRSIVRKPVIIRGE